MRKIIQKSEGADAPKPFAVVVKNGAVVSIVIAEDIKSEERTFPSELEGQPESIVKVMTWTETVFEQIKIRSYSALVSFLVRAKYSADDVEATLANAAAGNSADIEAVNAWRATVKPFARSVFPEG